MKKRFKFSNYDTNMVTARDFCEKELNGRFYDNEGIIEETSKQVNNVTIAFSKLMETLNDKNILSDDDVYRIIKNYYE